MLSPSMGQLLPADSLIRLDISVSHSVANAKESDPRRRDQAKDGQHTRDGTCSVTLEERQTGTDSNVRLKMTPINAARMSLNKVAKEVYCERTVFPGSGKGEFDSTCKRKVEYM